MSDTGAPPPPPPPVVSDQQIAEALHNILVQTNPNLFNLNVVVHHLQSILGLNLSHKLDFIRFQINFFFSRAQAQARTQAQAQARTQLLHHHHHQAQQNVAKDGFGPVQAQTQARDPAQQLDHQLQQEQKNVGKEGFTQAQVQAQYQAQAQQLHQLQQQKNVVNREYHFPANFSFQQAEEGRDIGLKAGSDRPVMDAVEGPKAVAQPGKKRRGGPGGLNKLCGVSPELQTIVGQPTMPRTEIVKQLWAYIKKNNLQDPNNKRKINCNDELRILFETDCTDMFKMNKLLSKHILPLDSDHSSKKKKVDLESGSKSVDSVPVVIISEVLANFLGTEEREMPQAEVLGQMWEYVKANNLEDPGNSMAIHCDEKLKELFGCESISALGIPEMLSRRHLTNKS